MSKLEELETKELVIDPEFEKLIPSLSEEEFRLLEEDVVKNGFLSPIIVWNQIILDGHNRYEIYQKMTDPIDLPVKNIYFESKEEAKLWILTHQLGRRNLQPYQRIELALKMKETIAAQAKANQRAGGGALHQNSEKAINTTKELASIACVSHDTFYKAEKINNEASDEDKEKLRRGEVSVNAVYTRLKKKDMVQEKAQLNEESPAMRVTKKICDGLMELQKIQHFKPIPDECMEKLGEAKRLFDEILSHKISESAA